MGRFVVGACAVALLWWVGSGSAAQLFAGPAPALRPQVMVAPAEVAYASPSLRGAPLPAAAPASPTSSAAKIGAVLCAGAAVYAICSRPVQRSAAPTMVVDPSHAVDMASNLMAAIPVQDPSTGFGTPIPAFTPGKAFVMMFSNLLVISTMTVANEDGTGRRGLVFNIQKGMSPKEAHQDMVDSLGLTWLLAGTSFGHVIGAGAILGCEAGGFL